MSEFMSVDQVTDVVADAVMAGLRVVEAHAPGGEIHAFYHDMPLWLYVHPDHWLQVALLLDKGVNIAELTARDGDAAIVARLSFGKLARLGTTAIALWDGF